MLSFENRGLTVSVHLNASDLVGLELEVAKAHEKVKIAYNAQEVD